MKIIKILILSFVAIVATSNLAYSQTASNALPKLEEVKTFKVKVKGVGCSADVKSIEENVQKLAGVSKCKSIKKGAITTFEVTMSPSMVTEKQVFASIEDTPGCQDPKDRPYKVKQ